MKKALTLAALFALSAAAQATTVFSDNFDANPLELNKVPAGWTVTDGTVDIIGPGFYSYCAAGQGKCIDLDGSTWNAGVLSKSFDLTAGVQYTASFELAGNHRGGSDTGTVSFGSQSLNFNLASNAVFSAYQLVFTPGATGTYSLSFANNGGDNIGALLDNVSVTAVPEPETYAMLLAGLGLIGAAQRRKSKAA
ncbi:MAG: PEPxxWA-CTERM sorting domain-containing protein [Burkholderiales bacterium]|nr:PEPxxWA-CTERM sorting domain-containing protein [Burkholderiales bacterium]